MVTATRLPKGHPDADPVWEVLDAQYATVGHIWQIAPDQFAIDPHERATWEATHDLRFPTLALAQAAFAEWVA